MSDAIPTRAAAERIVATIEAKALERFPGPLKDALTAYFRATQGAGQTYREAQSFLIHHDAEQTRKRSMLERRDAFYRDDPAGQALYERHVRQTSGDGRLLQSEVEKLFDEYACAGLVAFVKSATGRDDNAAALNVIFANAPELYEERRLAINAAHAGRPEAEVLKHVAVASDLAKRITRIAKSASATDPAKAIREGAAR